MPRKKKQGKKENISIKKDPFSVEITSLEKLDYEPVDLMFLPTAQLARFRPRDTRIGRYSCDTSKNYVVLFKMEQKENLLVIAEENSGKIITNVYASDLELIQTKV